MNTALPVLELSLSGCWLRSSASKSMQILHLGFVITIGLRPAKVKALAVTNDLSFTHSKGAKCDPRVTEIKTKIQGKINRENGQLQASLFELDDNNLITANTRKALITVQTHDWCLNIATRLMQFKAAEECHGEPAEVRQSLAAQN